MQQTEMHGQELSLEDLALVVGGGGSSSMNIFDPDNEVGSADVNSAFRAGGGKRKGSKKKKGKNRRRK